jgi:hypothetical protein
MKRAIGAAALTGGLLALSAGTASAQDVAADVSANLGRPTSARARVCADGRILSGLLGRCSGSGTSASAQADSSGIRVRARVPGTARADVSVGTRGSRPGATASGQASATPRSQSADASASANTSPRADAEASLTRRTTRLLDLDGTVSLAGVGLLGSSPFILAGDPATYHLLPTGELTLDGLTGEAPAGIGVLDTGPIASGNQVDVNAGDVSPSVPVTVCGNSVGVLGDTSASCGTAQPGSANDGSGGGVTVGTSGSTQADGTLAGNQVGANVDDVSATVPVTASCNSVGLLGDASSNRGTPNPDRSTDTSADVDLGIGTFGIDTGTVTGPGTDSGIGVDIGIDAGTETSTGGIIAPPPGTTSSGGTGADGTPGSSTGTSGIPGIPGLAPGAGGAGISATSFAPLRPSVAGSGALPFTGAASDLLALAALGLLVAGALVVRATRPAAAREGGDDR